MQFNFLALESSSYSGRLFLQKVLCLGGGGGDRGQRRKIETDTEACIWSLRDWALVLD